MSTSTQKATDIKAKDQNSETVQEKPEFDVTSGGFLRIEADELIKSKAAQRQIDAVRRLSSLETLKRKSGSS